MQAIRVKACKSVMTALAVRSARDLLERMQASVVLRQARGWGRQDVKTDLDEEAPDPASSGAGKAEGAHPSDVASGHSTEEQPFPEKAATETQNGAHEAAETSSFLRQEGEAVEEYAQRMFRRVFQYDVENVLKMEVCPSCSP